MYIVHKAYIIQWWIKNDPNFMHNLFWLFELMNRFAN